MRNLGQTLLRVEPLYGTLGNLNFKSGTFMWNFGEPELLRVDPLCGTLGNLRNF